MTAPSEAPPPRRRLKARTIATIIILLSTAAGSAYVAVKARDYNQFTNQAFQLMSAFTAARAADLPLAVYKPSFEALAHSDRAIGRLMAIAYTERTGTLQQRDRAIVAATNALSGRDLYRLLSAISPMFDPSAREAYIEGPPRELGSQGIDMRFNTLTTEQKDAMHECSARLQQTYGVDSFEGRFKIAASLYVGIRWERCSIPVGSGKIRGKAPNIQTI